MSLAGQGLPEQAFGAFGTTLQPYGAPPRMVAWPGASGCCCKLGRRWEVERVRGTQQCSGKPDAHPVDNGRERNEVDDGLVAT